MDRQSEWQLATRKCLLLLSKYIYIFCDHIFSYGFISIYFRVEKSNYFRRDGADVHTDANISLSQAVLGGTIRVQGVYEDQTIQVHPIHILSRIYKLNIFFCRSRLCQELHHILKYV